MNSPTTPSPTNASNPPTDESADVLVVTSALSVPEQFNMIHCRICNSKILRRQHATDRIVVTKQSLPIDAHDVMFNGDELEAEFWVVHDMFDFENIGFLKTVNDVKLLTCADCEREPLGVHVVSAEPKRYLIRTSRLKYQ